VEVPPPEPVPQAQQVAVQPDPTQFFEAPQPQQSQLVSTADDDGAAAAAAAAAKAPYEKVPRLTAWVCLLVASIIAMTSLLSSIGGGFGGAEWVFLVSTVSAVISAVALVGYVFMKHKFVGTVLGEGISSYLLFFLWIGGLAVAM